MDTARDMPDPPRRPGLPIDPLLQLWAGELTSARTVASPGGVWVRLAPADPMRVALYIWSGTASQAAYLATTDITVSPSIGADIITLPAVYHVRDYPGLVQSALNVLTPAPATVQWSAYTLSDQWR